MSKYGIIAMILAITAVSIALVPVSESDADENATFLEIPEVKAEAGATGVEVPMKIVDVQGTGFSSLSFDLDYEEGLTLKGVKEGTLMHVFPDENLSSPCTIVCEADDNVTSTGTILTFVFDVADDTAGMNLPLHIDNREAVNASGDDVIIILEGTATIVVNPDVTPVTSVTLDRTSLVLAVKEKYRLEATVLPEDATDRNVTWTSDNMEIANVDVLGYVEAIAVGTAKITVTTDDGGKTATCDVTVLDKVIPIESITLDATSLNLMVGDHDTLLVTITPDNTTADKTIVWSSNDTSVVTVDQDGRVEAIGPGIATVTAKNPDSQKSAFCVVIVEAVYVTDVKLDKTSLEIVEGGSEKLNATVLPEDATDKLVSWSSDNEKVATVDQEGYVTAVAAGTAKITVTTHDGNKTTVCDVTVRQAVRVTGVELDKSKIEVLIGNTEKLNATVLPDNADDKSVTWKSSDEKVATVDSEGTVTGVGVGSATITVTTVDEAKTAECAVTVNPVVVTGVTLDKTEITVEEGKVMKLVATVLPDNATDKTVAWSTSNPDVATVDHNGIVKGVAAGNATITVTTTDGSKTASCAVTVTEHQIVHVDSITLDKVKADVNVGKSVKLVPTVGPDNADDKSVTWKSSDEKIATVDQDGNVKAVATGNATITATTVDGGYSASCDVTVKEAPADHTLFYVGIVAAIVILLITAFFIMRRRSGKI